MGHAIVGFMDVNPDEGLLMEVKRSAAEVAWLDWKVGQATDDAELEPGGPLHYWDGRRLVARQHLARVAKLAHDAGVAERLVRQAELAGDRLLGVLRAVLTAPELGLSDDQLEVSRGTVRRVILELTGRDPEVLEGEATEGETEV